MKSGAVATTAPVYYPESDGKPMGETGIHVRVTLSLISVLDHYFRDDPEVYLTGNMFLYYEEGRPDACCCPDFMFIRGIGKEERRTYKLWEEGRPPDLVVEVTSKSSRFEDLGTKKAIYAALGVQEYYVFDPLREYLEPPFVGFRLEGEDYVRMEPSQGRLKSEVLGLELFVEGRGIRFVDPEKGELVRTFAETSQEAKEIAAALKREEEARQKEEKARKQEEEARKREEEARQKEEKARKQEEEARKRVEAENQQLRAELERLRVEVKRRTD